MTLQKATFAAGCFWGVEEAFRVLQGVISTTVGYTGGTLEDPTYEDVCTDKTGHAEAVEIEFESDEITFKRLLEVFWEIHDPTQLNRQGPDVGTQYRSAVFFHSDDQKKEAEDSKEELQRSGKLDRDIVTEITPAVKFYRAEEYHQKYVQKRGVDSCRIK